MWAEFLGKLQVQIQKGMIRGVVMMRHRTTSNTAFRNDSPYGDSKMNPIDKHHVRAETCFAFRLLAVIHALYDRSIPWVLVVPHLTGR